MKTSIVRFAIIVASAAVWAGCSDTGKSHPAGQASQALVVAPPAAPSDLLGFAVNGGQVNLEWTDNSLDETGFTIQRAEDEEFEGDLVETTVGPDETQYSDVTTLGLHTYFYRVIAVNENGASPPSEEARIFTPASSPTSVVLTPAGSPAIFQSGIVNAIEVEATGVGGEIALAEFQLLFEDAPGTYVAQDIVSEPDQDPFVIPAPIAGTPISDTTVIPALPASAIVEIQVIGRVAQVGDTDNGFEWRIGGTSAAPTFIVYESASTRFPRPRRPVVGDAVWIVACRTQAPGPLVAKRITFRAPDPQPVAPAAYKLAALYKGIIDSFDTAFSEEGVSYGGETVAVFNAADDVTVPFRVDYHTSPGFAAFVDDGLIPGNAVQVRFWVSKPTSTLPVARQIFPQVQAALTPLINPDPTHINSDPVPSGLPPGTFLQFMIVGVITDIDSNRKTWQIGDPEDPIVVYGHSLTIPVTDAFRVVPDIGDEVVVTARRTVAPGPLVADQILILADGPAPAFELAETRTQIVYLYNGTVSDTGAVNGGTRWTVTTGGVPQEFVMNQPDDPAILDRGPLESIGLGSPVTVEFLPPTQVLPEDNWAPLAFDVGTGNWSSSMHLPGVSADQTGYLFVRTTDVLNKSSILTIPAQLLMSVPNLAPGAADDSYSVTGTDTLFVSAPGVLGNDTDPELDALSAELVSAPTGTSAFTFNADGSFSFTYATNPTVSTIVTFTYRVTDGLDVSGTATVSITVDPPPVPIVQTFHPVADATVREDDPDENFGTSSRLEADLSSMKRAYLKFNVTGMSGTPVSAVLRLYVVDDSENGPAAYSTATSWAENTITWNNQPATSGGAFGDAGEIRSGTWVEYDVTSLVTGNASYAFALIPDSRDGADFSSREGHRPPQLVISTVGASASVSSRGRAEGSLFIETPVSPRDGDGSRATDEYADGFIVRTRR